MTEAEQAEHRVGMVALAEQIKNLVDSHKEVKIILDRVAERMADMERRANESCKNCGVWSRVNKLEQEMAGLTGRMAGISIAAGALAFLGSMFVRKQ